jgi:hypothetical protein
MKSAERPERIDLGTEVDKYWERRWDFRRSESGDMKTNNSANEDAALSGLLSEWKVNTALPPRFQERVWRRIEREEAQPLSKASAWIALRHWIDDVLPRPALAVAYMAVLLAAGAGFGWTRARHETARVSNQLSIRYVTLVDPYAAAP